MSFNLYSGVLRDLRSFVACFFLQFCTFIYLLLICICYFIFFFEKNFLFKFICVRKMTYVQCSMFNGHCFFYRFDERKLILNFWIFEIEKCWKKIVLFLFQTIFPHGTCNLSVSNEIMLATKSAKFFRFWKFSEILC